MMASIKGLQKTSLVDFPPYLSCTIFISTCNFKCGFCYNVDLVKDSKEINEISEEEILKFLEKRKKVLDGVCITGGEPTLYKNLKEFVEKIKKLNYKVKLDTNGTNPKILKELIKEDLLDYIAMDIKSSKERYEKAAGCKVDLKKIQESIDLIRNSKLKYEFRTTIHPSIFDEKDALSIGKWLKNSKKYAIQQFTKKQTTLDPKFMKTKPYDIEELKRFKKLLKPYFDEVELRA
jgi:pyruvate formate lyase activating enzyme